MSEETPKKLAIIGAGPGGYHAAFHAADAGMQVTLIDQADGAGGTCLYKGCIPSKTYLHAAKVMTEALNLQDYGISFTKPKIDIDRLREKKEEVVETLANGLKSLIKAKKINLIQGTASFINPEALRISQTDNRSTEIDFDYAVIATGSKPAIIPGLPESKNIWTSDEALELEELPQRLLIIGGGYIGLEMGQIYSSLGSAVSVVEMTDSLLPGADRDLVSILHHRLQDEFKDIMLKTAVEKITETRKGLTVDFKSGEKSEQQTFDRVLVSIGRKPFTERLGIEKTRIKFDLRGFIEKDLQLRTAEPTIFAIGDVSGQPMLAHTAAYEAKIAIEAIQGRKSQFDALAVPAVVFTDPEIAWCGLTETEAKEQNIPIKVAKFPWSASGRAVAQNQTNGLTKLIIDPENEMIVGVGIAGPGAGELIAEATLAIEMGANVEDIKMTIHAHPTFSETIMEAAMHYKKD